MKKILVVEDSTEIRDALINLIGNDHSIIQMDADSDPARLLSKGKIDIALIEISDLFNRRYDLIQVLLDLNHDIRIIFAVDSSLFYLAKPLLVDNLFDYLLKPIDSDKLRKKINIPYMADSEIEFAGLLKKIATEMAHRIKNPLATIKTYASLLKERFDDPEFRGAFYRSMSQEVERIDDIIERLISYSALEKPLPAPADLHPIIEDTINKFTSHPDSKDVRILTDLEADVPPVFVDRIQIGLVLENIFSFISMDAMKSGEIRVRCLRSSLRGMDGIEIEISYPVRRKGLDDKDLFVVDLFLAREVIRYQGGELIVKATDRQDKAISIHLPCCIGIESIMRLDINRPKRTFDNRDGYSILNYYDRRISNPPIPFAERRIWERRRGKMSLYLPEKRQILGVFVHL